MSSTVSPKPARICDLVMKGGVTSGVVYPLAICELARTYSFKNIGGTSAGAIAAAAAAAAECGRRNGSDAGFAALAGLPEWIGEPGRLLRMFQPDRSTKALFALLMAALNPKTRIGKVLSIVRELLIRFPITALILTVAIWAIQHYFLADLSGLVLAYTLTATLALALGLFLAMVLAFLYRQMTSALPANFYGMSRGCDVSRGDAPADAPLTNWLTHYLNELAGKPLSQGPLTFGDLYAAPPATGDPEPAGPDHRAINLEMMTTALNHGRPYRLPFRDPDKLFYFAPEELGRLFPPIVVRHLIDRAPASKGIAPQAPGVARLYALPDAEDLPVVVATRMSLSFPVLLGAVPLYAVDYGLKENQDNSKAPRAERCWFSDGGISSNLPIHFFDSPLPSWPTFAIDLKQFHPDFPREEDAVFLPENVRGGTQIVWTRFEEAGRFGSLASFLWSIVNAMQNWQDATQARIPGYRDRLVHVSQHDDEGGLNLNMPKDVVSRLSERGRRAGAALVARFGEPPNVAADGWTEHRWVRFRSCMELTETWIREIAELYPRAIPPDPTMEDVLMRDATAKPSSYRLGPRDQLRAKAAMEALLRLWAEWDADGTGFQKDPPRPKPALRIRPRV